MKEIKVLLVDDHKVVRDGIKYTLNLQQKFKATFDEAEDGEQAVQKAKVFSYDIIIMDVQMPNKDGAQATKEIIRLNKNSKILALSMFDEDFHILNMIKAGALGYIIKNTGAEELNNAINAVISGKKYYSNDVAIKLIGPYHDDIVERKPRRKNTYKGILSKREVEILKLIGAEFTNEEISKKLCISKRTVDSHRQNVMNKLQVKNAAGLIKYIMQNNLI